MVAFGCGITTSIIPFCFVWVFLFLLVVFVSFVGVSASDSTSSFLSLSWLLSFCFFFLFFLRFLHSMFFSSCCLSYPPPVFLSVSCVSFCGSQFLVLMYFFCPWFSFSYLVWMFLFCVFFSLFLLFLMFCVFFSPGSRMRLRRTTMERTAISFCLPFGDLCENVLCANLLFIFAFVDFFLFTEHVCVWYTWNMFWGSKGLFVVASYLLLNRCFGVWCRAVFLSNLSLVPAFLGIRSVLCSCFFILGASASFEFCWGLFFLVSLIFLILGCCYFAAVWSCWFFWLYVLAGCLCVSVSVLSFCGEPCAGACG